MSTGNELLRPKPKNSTSIQQSEDGRLDWLAAVEQLKNSLKLIEDKDVAAMLQVPVSTFSEFRNSAGNLPWLAKLKVLSLMGYESLNEVLDLLSHDESVEKNRRKMQRHARKTAKKT